MARENGFTRKGQPANIRPSVWGWLALSLWVEWNDRRQMITERFTISFLFRVCLCVCCFKWKWSYFNLDRVPFFFSASTTSASVPPPTHGKGKEKCQNIAASAFQGRSQNKPRTRREKGGWAGKKEQNWSTRRRGTNEPSVEYMKTGHWFCSAASDHRRKGNENETFIYTL